MIPFAPLLIKPIIDLISSFVKPIVIIGIGVFIDIQLGLGVTDAIVQMGFEQIRNQIVPW